VYDALNVLQAIGLIAKKHNRITYCGKATADKAKYLRTLVAKKQKVVSQKKSHLNETLASFVAL
jgi:hypothetical protein